MSSIVCGTGCSLVEVSQSQFDVIKISNQTKAADCFALYVIWVDLVCRMIRTNYLAWLYNYNQIEVMTLLLSIVNIIGL